MGDVSLPEDGDGSGAGVAVDQVMPAPLLPLEKVRLGAREEFLDPWR